jgi:putative mycofactocin binding protein MftB
MNPASDATATARYRLSPGVRARRENFGLLFYSSRDARLTFLKSGDLLSVSPDPDLHYCLTADCKDGEAEAKTRRFIELLLKKGLIVEERVRL